MYSGGNIRSAVTDDGTRFWTSGTANPSANGGVHLVDFGGTTSTQVATNLTNTRVVNIFNDGTQDQLFVSSASGMFQGVSAVGTGLPTSGLPVTIALLNGFPTASGPSNYDFFRADANTLYVADDRTVMNGGGIQKWTLNKGTWTLAYTLNANLGTSGCRGLAGVQPAEGGAVLYATTAASNANNLVTVTDTGASSEFAVLATAAANTAFRGVRVVPDQAPPTCPGDADGDGDVDVDDLIAVILDWGCIEPPTCDGDTDDDGDVDVDDLIMVILNWGLC
jgi:hypothetical protein